MNGAVLTMIANRKNGGCDNGGSGVSTDRFQENIGELYVDGSGLFSNQKAEVRIRNNNRRQIKFRV